MAGKGASPLTFALFFLPYQPLPLYCSLTTTEEPNMAISLSDGNSKLVKTSGEGEYKILSFGIVADYDVILGGQHINTCPGAQACRGVCYAKQGRYMMPNVYNARLNNLRAAMLPSFVDDMVAAIKERRSYNTIRVHDSGDMFSQEYLEKWYSIARQLPNHIFYAYTKSLHLDLYTNKPDNFRLIQSLGGKHDSLIDMSRPHSRIFSSDDARIAAQYVDGNINDLPAIEGHINIGLVYHGIRKLTLPQVKFFS